MFIPKSTISGFKDSYGDELAQRAWIIDKVKQVYHRYGYEPLETPAVEKWETLTGKGDDKLIYKLDSSRNLALHFDLTVPMTRFLAANYGALNMPFLRYQAQPVWRKETAQKGRYNEFWQFDADRVGEPVGVADLEIVSMMCDVMNVFGARYVIQLNDRRILDSLTQFLGLGISTPESKKIISLIDKVDKVGIENVTSQVALEFNPSIADSCKNYLSLSGPFSEIVTGIQGLLGDSELLDQAVTNIKNIYQNLPPSAQSNVKFEPKIARGLDYYTSTVFETILLDVPGLGSVYSGGRYDGLIHQLGGPHLPAIGASVGISRLQVGLFELGLIKSSTVKPKIMALNMGPDTSASLILLLSRIRSAGTSIFYYGKESKISDQFKIAASKAIKWVLILGTDELSQGVFMLRDLEARTQQSIPLDISQDKLIDILTQLS